MLRILHCDSVGGASGDMILAALIDLGADPQAIADHVRKLRVDPFELVAEPCTRDGIRGTRVKVNLPSEHAGPHHHAPHRDLASIAGLLEESGLGTPIRRLAMSTFERLAEAEAAVHGTTPDHVHFHEVGAMDAIVDIVGSCAALHLLNVDAVDVGPLPLGRGTTTCAHGTLPVPVPATVNLLKGQAVVQTDEPYELVTPTGAALLSTWQALRPAPPHPTTTRTRTAGCGFGERDLAGRPNILRVRLAETACGPAPEDAFCLVLECNLDDTVPELIGSLCARLLDEGALDVFTTAVQMKKQRPGTLLTVLCTPDRRAALLHTIFLGSTTFGIREYRAARTVLARRFEEVTTPYGNVRVKIGAWQGADVTRAPEYEDCVKRAGEHGVAVRAVYEAALAQSLALLRGATSQE